MTEKDEATDLLEHFVKWLDSNRLLKGARVEAITEGSATPEKPIVGRYMELQWGEDLEDEWGHAFKETPRFG